MNWKPSDGAPDANFEAFDDTDSFGGRFKRYARVGSAMGGIAARYAGGRFLGMRLDNLENASELKAALGGLKGPLMKVAQILSTVPDMLPEEYTAELTQLQTNAPSMGWSFVKRRMHAELGADWQSRFASFEHTAAAAASLGQVHRAVGHDGRNLACKLQYPDMRSAVEADLRQLKLIFSIYRRYDKAIDPSNIHTELSERLREELDYDREARHIGLYGHMLAEQASVHVPETVPDLCTDRLLTMTWLEGEPIMSFVDHNMEARNTVARNMFRAWYVPFYEYGVLHGDPHLGNYTVRSDGSINLLDFGCVRVFRPDFIRAVVDLYWSLRNNDRDLAVHAYETWGFKNLEPRGHRYPQPVGPVLVPAADGGSTANHPARGRHRLWRAGGRQGAAPASRRGRSYTAPRIRFDGSRRHRPRQRLHPAQRRGQLASNVP